MSNDCVVCGREVDADVALDPPSEGCDRLGCHRIGYTRELAAREAAESALAAERVANAGLRAALRDIDAQLATGFIRCETCGDQEDTADMDVRSDIAAALSAAPPNAMKALRAGIDKVTCDFCREPHYYVERPTPCRNPASVPPAAAPQDVLFPHDGMERCVVCGHEAAAHVDYTDQCGRCPCVSFQAAAAAPQEQQEAREHDLKVWPRFFGALASGEKTFEVRKDDRGFKAGDTLLLREWDRWAQQHTGNELRRAVTYILSGPAFGIERGYVVMALAPPTAPASAASEPKAPPLSPSIKQEK